MLLIIEIILTIVAWRKGWRYKSLIPMGSALVIGFLLGFGVGLSGGSLASVSGLAITLDVLAVIALIVLCVVKPKQIVSDEKKN